MEVRYGGDMEVVLTSKIWAQYPLYGYLWIRLDKCSPDLATSRLNWRPLLPELHQLLWHEPQYQPSCQILSKYRLMGYQSNHLIKERLNWAIYGHYLYTSVQCAISQIFQQGQIIPYFLAFLVCSLHWEQVEKWFTPSSIKS